MTCSRAGLPTVCFPPLRAGLSLDHGPFGSDIACRRGAGRLHRRPKMPGQHGPRLVGAALVRQPVGATGLALRHRADRVGQHWRSSANSGPEFMNAARSTSAASVTIEHGAESVIVHHQTAVSSLVVMYSINVFVTFSLSHDRDDAALVPASRPSRAAQATDPVHLRLGRCASRSWSSRSASSSRRARGRPSSSPGAVTGLALLIHRYYDDVRARLRSLDESLGTIDIRGEPNLARPDPNEHTAVILVGGYSGLGVHTLLNSIRFVPNHFKNMVFISVGVVDSGNFKGVEELEASAETRRRLAGKICRAGPPPWFPLNQLHRHGHGRRR